MTRAWTVAGLVLATAAVWGLAACGSGSSSQPLPGGQASRGKGLVEYYGCGACHVIGGIDTATGEVGPRLTDYQDTRYIAGHLANTPENTARWIEDPQRFEPGTIMPDLGVTPAQAADIATYLEGQ
jgi:cytochrome c